MKVLFEETFWSSKVSLSKKIPERTPQFGTKTLKGLFQESFIIFDTSPAKTCQKQIFHDAVAPHLLNPEATKNKECYKYSVAQIATEVNSNSWLVIDKEC